MASKDRKRRSQRYADTPQDVQVTQLSRKLAKDGAQIAASCTITTILTVLILRYPRYFPFVEISDMTGWIASDCLTSDTVQLQTQFGAQEAAGNCLEKLQGQSSAPRSLPLFRFSSVSTGARCCAPEKLHIYPPSVSQWSIFLSVHATSNIPPHPSESHFPRYQLI